jgi:hypothetical protein
MSTKGFLASSSPRRRKGAPRQLTSDASDRRLSVEDVESPEELGHEHPMRKAKPAFNKSPLGSHASLSSSMGNGATAMTTAHSRHLVTVIPPSYLPHDPPHPRTSAYCTG